MRKPAFCICKNKDADQLRGNREADQRLCFHHTDSAIPLLSKPDISSLWPSSVAEQPGLCQTRLKTPKTGFVTTRLIYCIMFNEFVSFCLLLISSEFKFSYHMSCVARKHVFGVSDQVRHKPGCTTTEHG